MLGMLGDKKKIATVIIGRMGSKSPSSESEETKKYVSNEKPEDDITSEIDFVADEMLRAIKNEDKGALASCLKSFMYKMGNPHQSGPVDEIDMDDEEQE